MDIVKILSEDGQQKEVNGIFYLYNSKYYLIYTEKEIDENGYVILYLVQVAKEIRNTTTGPVDTGYMIGMTIDNPEEWKNVQTSITKIVDNKKEGQTLEEIQYLPVTMLKVLKIKSNKKFRLMKDVVEKYFNVQIDDNSNQNLELNNPISSNGNIDTPQVINDSNLQQDIPIPNLNDQTSQTVTSNQNNINSEPIIPSTDQNIPTQLDQNLNQSPETIIDYRARFFEEQEKNKNLESRISELEKKLDEIKTLANL